jgi:hypothetical protein
MLRFRQARPLVPRIRHLLPAALLFLPIAAEAQKEGASAPLVRGALAALPDTSEITPALIEQGRKLYRGKGLCYTCHGMKLEGTPVAPAHRKSTGWKNATDGAFPELVRVIASGVPGRPCCHIPTVSRPTTALRWLRIFGQ